MTIEEAKKELPNIDIFCQAVCDICGSNTDYCPSYCSGLIKAGNMDFEKIQKSYARNNGDLVKVCRYIRTAK